MQIIIFIYYGSIKIRITVFATISTCVICTNINAFKTTTFFLLVFIF